MYLLCDKLYSIQQIEVGWFGKGAAFFVLFVLLWIFKASPLWIAGMKF